MGEFDLDDVLAKARCAVDAMSPEMMQQLYDAQQQMVPAELREAGWIYRDIPKMTNECWDQFLAAMGDGNYQMLISSHGDDWSRGQFFISPKAIENLQAAFVTRTKP